MGLSSVSRPSHNTAVLAGVLAAVSLLAACLLFDDPAIVSRRRFFLEDIMIIYRARKST
jgi:hypothetical protein